MEDLADSASGSPLDGGLSQFGLLITSHPWGIDPLEQRIVVLRHRREIEGGCIAYIQTEWIKAP